MKIYKTLPPMAAYRRKTSKLKAIYTISTTGMTVLAWTYIAYLISHLPV